MKNNNIKVLITGSGGMLGSAVVPIFRDHGFEVLSTSRRKNSSIVDQVLDVTDFARFEKIIQTFQPQFILHFAAETDVELCETQPDKAYVTNTFGVHNAAILSLKYDIPIVYTSTAGIFDGTKETPYIEFDDPRPLSVYGKSKYQGEKFIREHCKKYFITRCGWMIGGYEKDKKFVALTLDQIVSGKKELLAVDDKFGSPTFAPAYAKNLIALIDTQYYGTYNLVCAGIPSGKPSRYEIAEEIVKILNLKKHVKVTPVSSEYFEGHFTSIKYFAPRPQSELLENLGLRLRGLDQMPKWQTAIYDYVKELYRRKLTKTSR